MNDKLLLKLLQHVFYVDRPDVAGWRPGEVVTSVPPSAALIANRAIVEMMR